mgnify:CR=1 FL=1
MQVVWVFVWVFVVEGGLLCAQESVDVPWRHASRLLVGTDSSGVVDVVRRDDRQGTMLGLGWCS